MEGMAVFISILVVCVVLSPFWIGAGGVLAAASAEESPEKLRFLKEQLLKQYLKDERAATQGHITAREWGTRKQFLINRFIDAARRLDYIQAYQSSEGER